LQRTCATVGKQTIWPMNGVLDLACDGLVKGDGASVCALHWTGFLSLAVKAIHLQAISFSSCLAVSYHHLFLMTLLDHLSVAHFLFAHLALSAVHHFPVATEVRRGVLRKMGVPKR
jgi:hypothetical protein